MLITKMLIAKNCPFKIDLAFGHRKELFVTITSVVSNLLFNCKLVKFTMIFTNLIEVESV